MKRVVKKALDMGIDGIHFDNIGYNAEPDACKCGACRTLFRRFLAERYSGSPEKEALGRERFGFTDFTHASVPWFNRWNQAINQRIVSGPLQQEWLQFKTHSLTGALIDLARHIRSVNPGALVEANAGKAIGVNVQLWHGISPEKLYHHLDLIFNESGGFRLNAKGAMLTRVREMKLGRAAGVPVIMYCHSDAELAESLALNQGCFAGGGGRKMNAYFHKVKRYAARTESLAEIAVLYHAETLAYSVNEPYESFITLTQLFIERHMPFDVVHGKHLADLSRFRLLVLPDVECLSDEEARLIMRFVEGGGALLATEKTGAFDQWRRRRVHREIVPANMEEYRRLLAPRNALSELFGDAPSGVVKKRFGKGRAACLPELRYMERMGTSPEVWMYDGGYWAEPKNAAQGVGLIKWLLPEPRFSVKGRGKFIFEPLKVADTGEIALHVAVLDPGKTAALEITMRMGKKPAKVLCIDSGGGERAMKPSFRAGKLTVRIPRPAHHNVVVVR